MIFSLPNLYILVGLVMAFVAVTTALDRTHPRRFGSALFWGFYALVFLVGGSRSPT